MAEKTLWKIGGTGGHGTFAVVDEDGTPHVEINGLGGLQLRSYTVATAPPATVAGQIAYFSNGAAGSPCVAFSNGTNWLVLTSGSPIAAA